MMRTFGIGPGAQKGIFGRLGLDFRPKTSTNTRESVKQCVWKNDPFGIFLASVVDHIVPKKETMF